MSSLWIASSVTTTNGSSLITVQSNEDIAGIRPNSLIQVGANPLMEVKRTFLSDSGVKTIELFESWQFGAGTGQRAIAAPTLGEIKQLATDVRQLIESAEQVVESSSVNPTANSIGKRTNDGRMKTANANEENDALALGQLPDDVAGLYAKSNILGTVSQSGGVPTGAIIERGSNANGEYVKLADGTLICTHIKRVEYGSTPDSLGIDNWAFPATPVSNAPTSLHFTPVRYNADGNEDAALANVGIADALRASCRNASSALGSQSIAVRLYLERSVQDSFVSGDYFNVSCFMKSRWY